MFKKISLFFFGFGIIFIPLNALAYNNITTHPALTSEMVKLHNNFSEKKINNEEKQWIMDGSSEEDVPVTRTLNHFYDPIYQTGLSGDINAEELTPFIKILKPMILSAKDWAQDSYAQATFLAEAYKNAALNPYAQSTKSAVEILTTHTWEKAINSYINGDKQEAFRNLGHVLHLIEDMAVPAHVRNDHHMRGDAYESWTAQFGLNNTDVVSQLSGRRPLKFNSLNQYFDYLATYTNTHFYSQDTIGIQEGYNQPEWNYLNTKNIGNFLYSIYQDDFGEYLLVKRKVENSLMITTKNSISINDELIHSDYWSHLSKQAVLTGAGVIDLFFQEVEKYKDDLAFKERINKTIISTTIENIKEFFGNLFGGEKTEIADSNSEEIIDSNSNNSNEQFNEINLFSTPSPQAEFFNEVTINPSPFPTLSPTPLPSKTPSPSPTKTPSTTPTFSPSPSPSLTPTPSPSPSTTSLPTSGSSSKTINFCSISNGISASNKIIINEVAWMGTENSSNDEWIELKNISNESINISNWQLIDKDNQIKISFPNKILAPGEFYLLERTDDDSIIGMKANIIFNGAINDANEILQLFDNNCALQDEAKTNNEGLWPAGNKDEKRSMERDTDLTWHTYNGEINNGIYGTPKQENSLKTIEPSPLPSETPSPTPSPSSTPLPPPFVTSSKILISEISYDSTSKESEKDFIELYNPNDYDVDLKNWSLKIIKNNSTSTEKKLSTIGYYSTENHIIPAYGFFLIANTNFSTTTYGLNPDIIRSSFSLPTPTTTDDFYTIKLLDGNEVIIDEINYYQDDNLLDKSLERKANASSTIESMISGNDLFLGNSYDSDLMTDFIIRSPQPQNSFSLPEPREKPPKPKNIYGEFSTNSELILTFSLNYSYYDYAIDNFSTSTIQFSSTSPILDFEALYSTSSNDFSNPDFLNSPPTKLEIIQADWENNFFKGKLIDADEFSSTSNLYLVLISKDKEGMLSDFSEIVRVKDSEILPIPIEESIQSAPLIFYSSKEGVMDYSAGFRLSYFDYPAFEYSFISQESGYLKEIKTPVQSFVCTPMVKIEIYSIENESIKKLLGQSKSAVILNSFNYPNYFNWDFKDGDIVFQKNQQYLIRFALEGTSTSNCWAEFYSKDRKLSADIYGYKTSLKNLVQKTDNYNPLPEEETILDKNEITFAAQVFSSDNQPVKLQVELRSRQENFDDNIKNEDSHLYESNYSISGQTIEITVNNLIDDAYHWRARVIDINGNSSSWYYYGNPLKYYFGQYDRPSPVYDDKNNSDFYVDVERSNYPENTLYYQPINKLPDDNSNFKAIIRTHDVYKGMFFTFKPHQSGYVDSAEIEVMYGNCSFYITLEIYPLSPNQNDGLPNEKQLLAVSTSDKSNLTSSFNNYQSFYWKFDNLYLEANHYYALKIKVADGVETGTGNCYAMFGLNDDKTNSKIYDFRNNNFYLDFSDDLRLIIYKKDESEINQQNEQNEDLLNIVNNNEIITDFSTTTSKSDIKTENNEEPLSELMSESSSSLEFLNSNSDSTMVLSKESLLPSETTIANNNEEEIKNENEDKNKNDENIDSIEKNEIDDENKLE